MNRVFARASAAALFSSAVTSASAQSVSTEFSSATLWFALLIVLFVLLIAVGLIVAQDRDNKSRQGASSSERARSPEQDASGGEGQRRAGQRRGNHREFS